MKRATLIQQTDSYQLTVVQLTEVLGLVSPGDGFHVKGITFEFYGVGPDRETTMRVSWEKLTLNDEGGGSRLTGR